MPNARRRRSKLIYVVRSVREFPEEVQEWLGQSGHRATASPNVYDALAILASGSAPSAVIVSLEAVDWNELEFFVHAVRLRSNLHIYVTGFEHQHDKMEAACERGAHLFNAEALARDLQIAPPHPPRSKPASLLAGSLRSASVETETRIDLEPRSQETHEETDAPTEPPPMRLVVAREEGADENEDSPPPVPWAPSPLRPNRTPPAQADRPAIPHSDSSAVPQQASSGQPLPVELTPEELAALIGKPPHRNTASEQQPSP